MLVLASGCGDSASESGTSFEFDENFEFDETGNVGPNVAPNGDPNVVPNGDPNVAPNGDPNNVPAPACPTEPVGLDPTGVAAIDRGGAGPIVAYRSRNAVETFRRTDAGWEFVTETQARGARDVEVAGIIEGRDSQFYLATAAEKTTVSLCSSDGCIERNTYPFADAVELHATADSVVYVAGVSLDEPLPTFIISYIAGARSGRHAFAEAPSIPTQFGFSAITRPTDPLLRTEFRAAWDTGDIPLSYVSVNTSLLMELEPACNRLDLLGGRIIPLQSEFGVLAAASGDMGAAITYDACDGVSAPIIMEHSRGMLDFDVAQSEDPGEDFADVYWLRAGSLWGASIDTRTGQQSGATRRIAAVPGAQAVRATSYRGQKTVVVTLQDEVVALVDNDETCTELVAF